MTPYAVAIVYLDGIAYLQRPCEACDVPIVFRPLPCPGAGLRRFCAACKRARKRASDRSGAALVRERFDRVTNRD